MTIEPSTPAPRDTHRRSRLFVGMLILTLLLSPFALVGPLVALATPLRRAPRQMRLLWIVALAVTVLGWGLALFASSGLWPDWLMFDSEESATV